MRGGVKKWLKKKRASLGGKRWVVWNRAGVRGAVRNAIGGERGKGGSWLIFGENGGLLYCLLRTHLSARKFIPTQCHLRALH